MAPFGPRIEPITFSLRADDTDADIIIQGIVRLSLNLKVYVLYVFVLISETIIFNLLEDILYFKYVLK